MTAAPRGLREITWTGADGVQVTRAAAIPEFRAPQEPLPAPRRAALAAHLAAIAAEGFAAPPPGPPEGARLRDEAPEPALVAAACTACGGWCCQGGARSHAYLDAGAVLRWRADHPGAGPDAFVRDYLGRLPALSARGSCVYHGVAGCVLPRRLRADLCNAFHCSGLRALGPVRAGAGGEGG